MVGKQKDKVEITTNLAINTHKVSFRRAIHPTFDADSILVGIDTCTSATVCGIRHLFVGEIESVHNIILKELEGVFSLSEREHYIFHSWTTKDTVMSTRFMMRTMLLD